MDEERRELAKTALEEQIGIEDFLEMNQEDLETVFSSTFGDIRFLQRLQRDYRSGWYVWDAGTH